MDILIIFILGIALGVVIKYFYDKNVERKNKNYTSSKSRSSGSKNKNNSSVNSK